ncbi:hypothetical protein [Kitasatospora aureofaciens]|uniref:hypothetical protein n=1 Tax=Kitasatospora aureofaciens TaxID=1894 RepID=UPI0005252E72|nr:hypothetical protein [Kitasatospora aureofaciens]
MAKARAFALVEANHPTLRTQLKQLPWRDIPLMARTRATAHGRDEIRRPKVATVPGLPFPMPTRLGHTANGPGCP